MSARWEIVRSDAEQPWHARFVAANGRILFSTENYTRKRGVERAIESATGCALSWVEGEAWAHRCKGGVEVRYVDERSGR